MYYVTSWFIFSISLIFIAIFVAMRYFGVEIPFISGFGRWHEVLLLSGYTLLLIGFIAQTVGGSKEGAARGTDGSRRQTLLGTFAGIAGIVVAIVSVLTFWHDRHRSLHATTLQ